MNWYKKAQISQLSHKFAKLISNIELTNEWDFEENVKDLHELEFKYNTIANTTSYIHPERQENILNTIHDKAELYFENIKEKIIEAFETWKNEHRIDNPELWAEKVLETMEDFGDNVVKYILENGILWGGSSLIKEDIIKYIDPNTIKQILQQDMMDNLEPYEYQLEAWLDINHPEWKKEIEDPIEYAQTHDLQDDFQDDYLNNIDVQEYINDYEAFHLIDYYTIKKAIEKELYPAYMQQWEDAVTEIIENIDKAVQELENINEDDSISKMTAAISIALNVMHVGGNISQDKLNYSDNFLNEMSNMDTSEWTKEVTEEFAI